MKKKSFPTRLGVIAFAIMLSITIATSCEYHEDVPLPDEEELLD